MRLEDTTIGDIITFPFREDYNLTVYNNSREIAGDYFELFKSLPDFFRYYVPLELTIVDISEFGKDIFEAEFKLLNPITLRKFVVYMFYDGENLEIESDLDEKSEELHYEMYKILKLLPEISDQTTRIALEIFVLDIKKKISSEKD